MLGTVRHTLNLLNKQIKLQRSDGKVRVVLDNPASTDRLARQRGGAEQAVDRMRIELSILLDRHEASRRSLRQLAGLEHALKAKGAAAFDALPERVLARASEQLEAVLNEPVSVALAELRSRLAVTRMAIEKTDAAVAKNAGPSSFLTDDKLQVSEASVSDFMRAVEQAES